MKRKSAIILGIVCFILTIAIFIQIKTVNEMTHTVGSSLRDNGELIDEVFSLQEKYKRLYKKLETSQKNLEGVRKVAAQNSENDVLSEEELKKNNKLLGLTEVKGTGLVITVDDNRSINEEEVLDVSKYLVHEEDLVQIVNELFNAGADAISINNQRIVSTSSILCDGNIIRVNGEKIGVPIKIKAIGHPTGLEYALMRPGGYLKAMQNEGVIVQVEQKESVTIDKYSGIYNSNYIKRGE